MEISFYSIIMATLTSSILIAILHFVYRVKKLSEYFGLTSVIILYVFTLLRLFLPIEFSSVNVEIKDPFIYPHVVKFMERPVFEPYIEYQQQNCFSYMHIVCIIIAIGAGIMLYRLVKETISFKNSIPFHQNITATHEQCILDSVCDELGIKKKIKLVVIDQAFSPLTYGLISPVILLPRDNFTDDELKFVFKHELNHIKNHDSLLKLLVEIYCCVFWWNPLVYVLRRDVAHKIELRCDRNATRFCSMNEKSTYLYSIIKVMKSRFEKNALGDSKQSADSITTSNFAAKQDKSYIMERFSLVLDSPKRSAKGVIKNIAVFSLCLLIFVSSYVFIFRPHGGNPPPEALEGVSTLIDERNSYLLKQPDGGYLQIYNDEPFSYISEEEYNAGGYKPYKVVDG